MLNSAAIALEGQKLWHSQKLTPADDSTLAEQFKGVVLQFSVGQLARGQMFEAIPSVSLPPFKEDSTRPVAGQDGVTLADVGEWSVKFVSDTEFWLYRPDGRKVGDKPGKVGAKFNNVFQFTVPERMDDFTIRVSPPVTDWGNLARVNEKFDTADGNLDVDFQTDYLCIKNLADQWGKLLGAPGMAEISDWLSDQLESRKPIPWRMSLAA